MRLPCSYDVQNQVPKAAPESIVEFVLWVPSFISRMHQIDFQKIVLKFLAGFGFWGPLFDLCCRKRGIKKLLPSRAPIPPASGFDQKGCGLSRRRVVGNESGSTRSMFTGPSDPDFQAKWQKPVPGNESDVKSSQTKTRLSTVHHTEGRQLTAPSGSCPSSASSLIFGDLFSQTPVFVLTNEKSRNKKPR